VTNTDRGSLVRIPIQSDGTAGAPSEIAGPSCADLNGADGLTIAHNGDLIVAVNVGNFAFLDAKNPGLLVVR
jgi:hypothetical protein